MPEYLAPGVYIEEVSFRAKTIEGVSTSTAGFVGPARFGPAGGDPELLTSFAEFERIYGGLDPLEFTNRTGPLTNYLAHGVRSFFDEGGKRLYVSRVFRPTAADEPVRLIQGLWSDGHARWPARTDSGVLGFQARYPGAGGNVRVTVTARLGQNVLSGEPLNPADLRGPQAAALRGVSPFSVMWISEPFSPPEAATQGRLYWAERYFDNVRNRTTWRFHPEVASPLQGDVELTALVPSLQQVRVLTLTVEVTFLGIGRVQRSEAWEDVTIHPDHPDSLSQIFAPVLTSRLQSLTVPIIFNAGGLEGPAIARGLLGQPRNADDQTRIAGLLGLPATADLSILATLPYRRLSDADRRLIVELTGGGDGERPQAADYEGIGDTGDAPPGAPAPLRSGLIAFENLPEISIVAAPGSSFEARGAYRDDAQQVMRLLISHCERMRYRIAVLDCGDGQAISEVRAYRGQVDSTHAALYYPWVTILDPVSGAELNLPPSGFVAGIYARNDIENGVHKAPANEVVRDAIGLEQLLNKSQQDVLNPDGINCFRFFEGRGYRLWGARTISSDPEWKYVNLRRYFAYLERSIERGTQWVVFENNGDTLWARVRRTVEDFLFNEWRSDRLLGTKPETAYFVRCDRSTMTQNDLDNGRLICLVGVSPLRPAEFVIFRIGQWTADRPA